MIEPAAALSTAAQIAVTLVGFAGVVVAFGQRAVHEWSAIDRFRLQLLLTTSAHALACCMVSMLLLATELSEPLVWGWSSGAAIASQVPMGVTGWRRFRTFRQDELQAASASKVHFYVISAFVLTSGLLQIYNVLAARVLALLHAHRRLDSHFDAAIHADGSRSSGITVTRGGALALHTPPRGDFLHHPEALHYRRAGL